MIKKIAYVLVLVAGVLVAVNLGMSHALASGGENLSRVGEKARITAVEIEKLKREVAEAESLGSISPRAQELGFSEVVKQRVINPQAVAQAAGQ